MLQETAAIILSKKQYKDECLIVSAYTEKFGRVNYSVYGAHSRQGGRKLAFLQPMSIVTITADYRPKRDLQVLRDVSCTAPLLSMLTDPVKNTMAVFLAEFLTHALRTNECDEVLFLYLRNSIMWLNLTSSSKIGNFHISFLVRLSVFLGFTPNLGPDQPNMRYFDLLNSEYLRYARPNADVIDLEEQQFLRKLLRINYRNMHLFLFSRAERSNLLNRIIRYYQMHIHGFGQLKTLDVLHEVFDS
ncbi:MAG: DNA repair protein RecO [Paludibacteraceae bacterium]|nr:recombination protein O N-terminal domain-containing protein [Paludibacteraceae bacterium]MBR6043920.1 recombination protein O N-terminal domain-containing protein [Paludibacteraceae bacterium]MCR5568382.1 DNA repair protein RecO [Paludibacteraceae bacterium]